MSLFNLFGDDPGSAAELALAAGLLGGRGSFNQVLGNALLGGQQAFDAAQAARQRAELTGTQITRAKLEEAQLREAQAQKRLIDEAARASMISPAQQALAGGGGPTPQAAERMAGLQPQFDQAGFINRLFAVNPAQAFELQARLAKEGYTLAPGAVRFDANNRQVAAAPANAADKTSPIAQMIADRERFPPGSPLRSIMDAAIQKATTHPPGVQVSYGQPVAGIDEQGKPVFFQPAKGGGPPAIMQGVQPPPRAPEKLTEAEAKAAAYASQMAAARREMASVGYEPNTLLKQAQVGIAGTPARGLAPESAQRVRQSQEQWAEAYLRFKTGAAATEAEVVRNVRTFFPVPGDSPGVIAQKARMREQAEQDVRLVAGRAGAQPRDQQAGGNATIQSGADLGGGFRVK